MFIKELALSPSPVSIYQTVGDNIKGGPVAGQAWTGRHQTDEGPLASAERVGIPFPWTTLTKLVLCPVSLGGSDRPANCVDFREGQEDVNCSEKRQKRLVSCSDHLLNGQPSTAS